MAEGSNFSLDISRWVERSKGNADLVVRKVALEVLTRVVMMSPVDTGRFRGNWTVSIGSVDSSVSAEDKSRVLGAIVPASGDVDPSGGATIARGSAVIPGASAGQSIFITNNLPYARRLEHGWSKQAPAGMVRVVVQEFNDMIQKSVGGLA